jgi:hypothetical protein
MFPHNRHQDSHGDGARQGGGLPGQPVEGGEHVPGGVGGVKVR